MGFDSKDDAWENKFGEMPSASASAGAPPTIYSCSIDLKDAGTTNCLNSTESPVEAFGRGMTASNSVPKNLESGKFQQQHLKETLLKNQQKRKLAKAAVSVGAGAEIFQDLQKDTLKVSDWKEEASSIIRLYFVFADEFESILNKGGIKDLDGDKDGYLKGLPVG